MCLKTIQIIRSLTRLLLCAICLGFAALVQPWPCGRTRYQQPRCKAAYRKGEAVAASSETTPSPCGKASPYLLAAKHQTAPVPVRVSRNVPGKRGTRVIPLASCVCFSVLHSLKRHQRRMSIGEKQKDGPLVTG
ncbi:hypothetical protein J3E72DRAFT_416226 [Bipolaris maydis]|nr:hypothetical protein J3E72DRAFT_416226 [Bipolaris maydis]